ncbi:vWA domain-containing protein [Thalassotalea crassostreae]|uniref:vWA domain-containing protein n=1 Tax=Thalassotalea crassostreae TaxID=1763536 RepID=UPI000838A0D8|nr:VWA domain-containing protein [Thalassotalea crassostreae]
MSYFTFLQPHWLWLLLLLPCWLLINRFHQQQSVLDLKSFSAVDISQQRLYLQPTLMLITISMLVLALARPGWDPQPQGGESKGRDLVFVLDVSRSMLANDARPNRLEVARQAIQNTINASKADRFGLVVFAGSTSIQSPLTNDKTFFNFLLQQVNTDTVAQGGTRIEDALFKVLDKMSEKNQSSAMDIILISDGEDLGSQPQRALTKLNELGARLIVIGLGDSEFGARIPTRDGNGWQFYQGSEVWSRMHTDNLRNLAEGAEQGMFIPVATATFDLVKIIEKLKQVWPSKEQTKGQVLTYQQGYPYCLFIALLAQIICWLRGTKFWLTGLVLLSFNSQALPNQANTSEIAAIEHFIDTSQEYLATLKINEQFAFARSLFDKTPERAAEVYRYIANHTNKSNVVITANYNLATSLINHAEDLTQQLDSYLNTEEEVFDEYDDSSYENRLDGYMDDEEYIDPEIYYSQAADLLRGILLYEPNHKASQQNLEWLVMRQIEEDNNSDEQQTQDQQSDQEQESKKQQESESKDNEQQNDEQTNESEQSKEQQSKQSDSSSVALENVELPPPNATAEEILKQAEQRNLTERAPHNKKQTKVDRDW